jgi:hypothetical protein
MSRAPLQVRFDVAASIDDVRRFVIVDYFTNHTRWDRGLLELVPLDDWTVQPGARGRETRQFLGRKETEFEIVEVTDTRLRLRDEPSAWTLERTYELEPSETGTSLTFTFAMEPNHWLFRLVYPLARPLIARQVRRNMGALAGLLDQLDRKGSSPEESKRS